MERKIFLKKEQIRLGCGSTTKFSVIENYYEVEEIDEKRVLIRPLDIEGKPIGQPILTKREEITGFIYCENFYKNNKSVDEQLIYQYIERGDKHLKKREFYSAEREYNKALEIDHNNLKANLGKGKALYARGEKAEAKKIFQKILEMESLYENKNRLFLIEFGKELCEKGMFKEAIYIFKEANFIDPEDEILHYHLAQTYFLTKDYEKSFQHLNLALEKNPDFKEAKDFIMKLKSHNHSKPQ